MTNEFDPVVSPEALTNLGHDVRLFDVRSGPHGKAAYDTGHLRGAVHADLDTQLSGLASRPERGGRHPLPAGKVFAAQLGAWGITPTTHLIAYDDQGGASAAARLWWMLRALGHERVQVLDGGLAAALAAGFELTAEVPNFPVCEPYPSALYGLPLADIAEVEQARSDATRIVLDVRAAVRFRGEAEPIDPIAGHIPGARNIPLTENLAASGHFKSAEELRALYGSLLGQVPASALIVHCGSGVTACHTLLALARAGLHNSKLYIGSWGEWCRTDRPRAP